MPDDASDPEQSRGLSKALIDPSLKGRLLGKVIKGHNVTAKAVRKDAPLQTDVDDFLWSHKSTNARPIKHALGSFSPRPVHNIDASDTLSKGAQFRLPVLQLSSQPTLSRSQQRSRKGLHVTFSSASPEIIGEGGDDADLPSTEVLSAWVSKAEVPPLQPDRLLRVASGADEAEVQRESDVSKSLYPATRRPSTPPKQKTPYSSSPEQYFPKDGSTATLTLGLPTSLEALARSGHADENPELSNGSDSSQHIADELPMKRKALTVNPFLKQDADRPTLFQVASQRSGLADSLDPMPQPRMLALGETVRSSTKDIPLVLLPGTPSHPADAYIEIMSPYPDDQPHGSPPQIQENGSLKRFHDTEDNDIVQDEFYSRVQHLHNVFRLASETSLGRAVYSLSDWIRVCIWWFLRGRNVIETTICSDALSNGQGHNDPEVKQAYVNLAKAWWIEKEKILGQISQMASQKELPGITNVNHDAFEHAHLQSDYDSIVDSMRALTALMKKHRLLPPLSPFIQGTDTNIWIQYPKLGPYLANVVSASLKAPAEQRQSTLGVLHPIPLADNERYFSYGSLFAEIEILSDEEELADLIFPCIISLIRQRTNPYVEITIVSQDGQIGIHVQSDKQKGPTWADVQWKPKSRSIRLGINRGLQIVVRLEERDFKSLQGIHFYSRHVERDWRSQDNEYIVYEDVVKTVQYVSGSQESRALPNVPLKQCRVRLLKQMSSASGGTGSRKIYQGHRLVIQTPANIKTVSSMNLVLDQKGPLLFSHLRGENNAPALLLSLMGNHYSVSAIVLTFNEVSSRECLHACLNGTSIGEDEVVSGKLVLRNFSVIPHLSDLPLDQNRLSLGQGLQWGYLQVINEDKDMENGKVILSEHLRVCIYCNYGTIVDRINLGKEKALEDLLC